MWKKILQSGGGGGAQVTIWRMRISCWIPEGTDTHSEYVILIAFPQLHSNNGNTNASERYVIRTLSVVEQRLVCSYSGTHHQGPWLQIPSSLHCTALPSIKPYSVHWFVLQYFIVTFWPLRYLVSAFDTYMNYSIDQRFSSFFQVGTTFISQNVLRTTLLLGLSNSLGLP